MNTNLKHARKLQNFIFLLVCVLLVFNLFYYQKETNSPAILKHTLPVVSSNLSLQASIANVGIIQDVSPGSYPGFELTDILNNNGIFYSIIASSEVATIDLSQFDKV
ncbi:MAG: hypothetical protein ACW99Q_28900, partial [Candidatus Kariarchaeaceae archaeon]